MTTTTRTTADRVDLGLRVLLGLFFMGASAIPKLVGEVYAVQIFEQMGAPAWLRIAIGLVELAGGIGLLVPRVAGAAAVGLIGLMVGSGYTQVFVLDQPLFVITPVILAVLLAVIVRHHRASTSASWASGRRVTTPSAR